MEREPVHEIKLGSIRVTIGPNGEGADVTRLCRKGHEWMETTMLRSDDFPIAMKAIGMAYTWIRQRQIQVKQAERDAMNQTSSQGGK